jgi:seryl-tRNA synthetase
MWPAESIIRVLLERGELWSPEPGLVGLRGHALTLSHMLEERVREAVLEPGAEEWRVPQALPLECLTRAGYFASFPQWLTVASHLRSDGAELESLARSSDPAEALPKTLAPPGAALPPAVCYHVYSALADTVLPDRRVVRAAGTCWRHEGDRFRPLERGWGFTMHEAVCLGTIEQVEAFRAAALVSVRDLAVSLGLEPVLAPATDPFFAPTARGRSLLQRVKGLKHELLLPLGDGSMTAAASVNHHETFFGDAFRIRLPDGRPASTSCVAFGLERWVLAFLVAHGPDPSGWPTLDPSRIAQEA